MIARVLLLLGLSITGVACSSPMQPDASLVRQMQGRWAYTAVGAPSIVVDGALVITRQQGASVSGSLEARESLPTGELRSASGIVAGQVVRDSILEFDVILGADRSRRHVGVLSGDSVVGNWLEATGVRVIASGTFRARRKQ